MIHTKASFEASVLTADDAITCYWERADMREKFACEVFLNGAFILETEKTHFTLNGLAPDTEYAVGIRPLAEDLEPLLFSVRTSKAKRRIDVTLPPYLAVGNGKDKDTDALQRAIDECGKDDCVYLPAGVYLSGALRLHSDMQLYIEKDAVLLGSGEPEDYLPRIKSRFEGLERECYSSLLNIGELDDEKPICENVLICGKGEIRGGGRELAERTIEAERELIKKENAHILTDDPEGYECDDTVPGRVRSRLINISRCRNVRISGLTVGYGASWNIHMLYSSYITTDNCLIRARGVWNGDGWDPDSSENCVIFACRFDTGDDCIAVKSGKNPEGNRIARPSRHIRIFDCAADNGNGFAMGSEMSGGIEDVRIWDCDVSHTRYGVEIKATPKRGGYVRDIRVSDTATSHIMVHCVLYNNDGEGAPTAPEFDDFLFRRITVRDLSPDCDFKHMAPAIELIGFEKPGQTLSNVVLTDVDIQSANPAIAVRRAENVSINLSVK